jgi:hypothetical protein
VYDYHSVAKFKNVITSCICSNPESDDVTESDVVLHQPELGLSVESPPPIPPKKRHDYPEDSRYVRPQIVLLLPICLYL